MTAAQGANAAGGHIINSVAMHIDQATMLPAEAYEPIPDNAALSGLSNISQTQLFVGRTVQLGELDTAFATFDNVVLSGLGGVGKSYLAAHWVATRALTRVRWWITADRPAAIDDGLVALACALQPGLMQLPVNVQKERALHWLAGHDDWLIVLDNVDHLDHIRPLLNRVAGAGRVLVTTRLATGWHQVTTPIHLDVFTSHESAELFTRILNRTAPKASDGAVEVCEELGHLALAIEQAAAFCHETDTSPHAYLAMLSQSPAEMLGPEASGGERTVARIWHITLDRLASTPLAGQILRILAWYAPDRIPRNLLEGIAEPLDLASATGRLVAYSMASHNHDDTLSVHRLVQALARTPDPDDALRAPHHIQQAREQATLCLSGALPSSLDSPTTWEAWRTLIPHVRALADHAAEETDTVLTAGTLNQAALFLNKQGAWSTAILYLQRALTAFERALGNDHPFSLTCRNNLATAKFSSGDLTNAIPLLERTHNDCARLLGEHHPDTLHSLNNLAVAYQAMGDMTRAIPLFEQILDDRVRQLGEDHLDTLTSHNNLAYVYGQIGDLPRAVPLFEQTVSICERVLGDDHPSTLTSRNNLAQVWELAGNLNLATRMFERNFTDRERVLGEEHPDTLNSRNNLAYAYSRAGDLTRAIPLFEQAVADCVRLLGDDHPDTSGSRSNLAHALVRAGDLTRAIPLFEQTLISRMRVLGDDHPDTRAARHNLAHAYAHAGGGDLTLSIRLIQPPSEG